MIVDNFSLSSFVIFFTNFAKLFLFLNYNKFKVQGNMAIEILLIRLFEISMLIGFFILTVAAAVFLMLLKSGLFILGITFKPTVFIILFSASRCLNIVTWSLQRAFTGFAEYGHKLME